MLGTEGVVVTGAVEGSEERGGVMLVTGMTDVKSAGSNTAGWTTRGHCFKFQGFRFFPGSARHLGHKYPPYIYIPVHEHVPRCGLVKSEQTQSANACGYSKKYHKQYLQKVYAYRWPSVM